MDILVTESKLFKEMYDKRDEFKSDKYYKIKEQVIDALHHSSKVTLYGITMFNARRLCRDLNLIMNIPNWCCDNCLDNGHPITMEHIISFQLKPNQSKMDSCCSII